MEGKLVVDITAPLACFVPPYSKAERRSSPVPTPSAICGALSSIYLKPSQFYWVVKQIEVLSQIKYITVKTNGVDRKARKNLRPIQADDPTLQITTTYLQDVHYRVTASIVPFYEHKLLLSSLEAQAVRRIKNGQCFRQPYLGRRECSCDIILASEADNTPPIQQTQDFGLMVYDTHIPYDNSVNGNPETSLYHCMMKGGVILVPDYNSSEVIKVGGTIHV